MFLVRSLPRSVAASVLFCCSALTAQNSTPAVRIVDRIDDMVKVGETMLSPLSITEHAVRGVLDRLRNRTAQ